MQKTTQDGDYPFLIDTSFLSQCSEGNNFFKNKQFAQAIQKYTEAIKIDGNNHTYWSNRSACHAGLDNWEESAKDARQTIIVNKKFIKGYFRLATALKNLNDLDSAREALQRGLVIEPMNSDLKSNMKVRWQPCVCLYLPVTSLRPYITPPPPFVMC